MPLRARDREAEAGDGALSGFPATDAAAPLLDAMESLRSHLLTVKYELRQSVELRALRLPTCAVTRVNPDMTGMDIAWFISSVEAQKYVDWLNNKDLVPDARAAGVAPSRRRTPP
jgi:hypothetical protein